jgi:putative sigma-54 modulation protein
MERSRQGRSGRRQKERTTAMNIKITYKHLDSTPGIDEVTHRKSEKLSKYFKGKMNLDWNFTVEKQDQIARCHLTGDHIEFFSESKSDNLYQSIDEVISCLERQVKKHKEVVRNQHPQKASRVVLPTKSVA